MGKSQISQNHTALLLFVSQHGRLASAYDQLIRRRRGGHHGWIVRVAKVRTWALKVSNEIFHTIFFLLEFSFFFFPLLPYE